MFDKEREARQYGAVITNRTKITTLRNEQKEFIKNQNIAKRDEYMRQQISKMEIKKTKKFPMFPHHRTLKVMKSLKMN